MTSTSEPSGSSSSLTLPALPHVPGTDSSTCVLDSFRTAIAQRISDALPPITLEQAYAGVDYGKKGADFTVALPRFRLPGKVDELAAKVISKVSASHLWKDGMGIRHCNPAHDLTVIVSAIVPSIHIARISSSLIYSPLPLVHPRA